MASWYKASKAQLLSEHPEAVRDKINGAASADRWSIDPDQVEEWEGSIALLQKALKSPGCSAISSVLLEYDFRRRGLRIDCILIAPSLLFILNDALLG